ncbi:transcription factor E2F8 isoform X2 [Clupea harengus]|uniref:Transcription factor E2F8 n=1 Tax=Clupea harengus TaxID=7950 RepID=A0A8M1KQL4_CLUHA|nr:transcription factor E2F8 isoform X2 [Clupea harengus]
MSSALQELQNLNQKPQTRVQPAPDHKGDVFAEPNLLIKTPRKVSSYSECQQNMGPLTTPTKGNGSLPCEPWTPTSNLKMLISAASPEIRNRERELCKEGTEGGDSEYLTQIEQEPGLGEEAEKLQISRKEKSLGLLCHKFLARYPDYPNTAVNNDICLDDVAGELNVERRRIYDIMNVLESLHMVSRLAKNRYTWHGRSNLPQTLAMLRRVGEEQQYGQQVQQIRQWNLEREDREFDLDGEEKENDEAFLQETDGENGQKEMCFVELPGLEFKASVNSRKDKSLRVMSQKFVMLFLVTTPRVVSLEVAAKILIGEDQVEDINKCKFKTKIRRLYDIANVLSSLELIKKVHVTEERGRKTAFKWAGPEDLPSPKEVPRTTFSTTASTRILESRSSIENCAKNLFSSPGGKRGFTRHPSLVKMVKSIQDDRRKINSAPSSPIRATSNDLSNSVFLPSKMAQLAAICKKQLDQQSKNPNKEAKGCSQEELSSAKSEKTAAKPAEEKPAAGSTPLSSEAHVKDSTGVPLSLLTPSPLSHLPATCSSLIPVLLPQHQMGGPIAVYMHPASLRPHASTRPAPTSLAVRSMTFESPGDGADRSPMPVNSSIQRAFTSSSESGSPSALKRKCGDKTCSDRSPSKIKKVNGTSEGVSPKLCEILQARLKARRGALVSSRPSSRALHLDPEFTKPPENQASPSANSQTLEHSVETFLEKEERAAASDSEAMLTPLHPTQVQSHNQNQGILLHELMLSAGHTETLIPTGYLIPITPQSLFSYKDSHGINGETGKASTPTNIYKTPTAGSRPFHPQEFTPTSLSVHPAPSVSPFTMQRTHSPSPAILNFTLQNIGLIPTAAGVAGGTSSPMTVEHASPLPTAHIGLPHRGMIFVKPMSSAGALQHPPSSQPLTLFSLAQPLMATPKGSPSVQHSLFHTPVPSLTTMTTEVATKTLYIPQRKLEVSPEAP